MRSERVRPRLREPRARRRYLWWALLVVVGALSVPVLAGPGVRLARHLGLHGDSHGFLAAGFTDPGRLPRRAPAGSTISFGVEVASHESTSIRSTWRAVVTVGSSRSQLASGRVRLDAGDRVRVRVTGTLPVAVGPATVRVDFDRGGRPSLRFPLELTPQP